MARPSEAEQGWARTSPVELFVAVLDPARDPELRAFGLEVVARPGAVGVGRVEPGDLLLRRALGEARLALWSTVEGRLEARQALEARGVPCEGRRGGLFVEASPQPGGPRAARRVVDERGAVTRDTAVVRLRREPGAPAAPTPALEAEPALGEGPAMAAEPAVAPEPLAEAASDPVVPVLAPLALGAGVGRGGPNRARDVRAVQDRLVTLRELSAADAAAERPAGTAPVAEASLASTIAAIEALQRRLGLRSTGSTGAADTRLALDRSLPIPTAAEVAAVAARRAAISETVSRPLALTGPVGRTGNAPGDVRALQGRLVEYGALAAAHGEEPPAGATAPVPAASLRATIAGLQRFQRDVQFWLGRGTGTGRITDGVVAPGDATAQHLDRVSVYELGLGAARVRFHDHVVSGVTHSAAGVMFAGTAPPSALPAADYVGVGLTPGQAAALQVVSRAEGNFDALNTYDVARVSVGFIQFAGGRGLPPYLALWKSRNRPLFRSSLEELGIDVEFTVASGRIVSPQLAVLDATTGAVRRGERAEEAIRDDKRLSAALLLSGRDHGVQLLQLEAAVRDYVLPALAARVTFGAVTARLGDLVRSERGMAMLFDRAIQEGLGGARARFGRVVQAVHAARPAATAAAMQAREADVLALLRDDLRAAADVATSLGLALAAVAALRRASGRPGATVAAVLARPELAAARRQVGVARARLAPVVTLAPATLTSMDGALRAEDARLAFTPAPASAADLTASLTASRRALVSAAGPVANAPAFLRRIEAIAASPLAPP